MRRRRAMVMVAAKVIGAAIGPRRLFVKVYRSFLGGPNSRTRNLEIPGRVLRTSPECHPGSDHRIPRRRDYPITAAVLFDVAEPRERVVEALHLELVRHQHVVGLAAGLLGHGGILIEEGVPTGVGRK